MSKCCASLETHHEEKENIQRNARGSPLGGCRYITPCYVYIINNDISNCSNGQLSGAPQNTGPQAIACLACPIATPLAVATSRQYFWLS